MDSNSEIEYASKLNEMGYLPGPDICKCGAKKFTIQNYHESKTSGCIFRCINSKCRQRFPIRVNSFFERHPYVSLKLCSEIIKCCICFEFNITKTKKYINTEKNTFVSTNVIRKIYESIRFIMYKYLRFKYITEKISVENKHQCFSVDESEFTKTKKR